MAQWLGVLAALAEEPGFLAPRGTSQLPVTLVPGDLTYSSGLQASGTYIVHIKTCRQKTYT